MIFQHLAFMIVVNIRVSSTYNLAIKEETATFIRSPGANLEKNDGFGATNISKSSFFGYSFFFTDGDNPRLMVGSPKLVSRVVNDSQDPYALKSPKRNSTGNIEVCKATFMENITDTCSSANPPSPRNGDNFGLEVSVNQSGASFACSPTRELSCGVAKSSPGFCYNSPDFGETWNATKKSKSQECLNITVEILFVLDGSNSVRGNFSKVKDWVKNTTKRVGMEDNGIRVGVIQYSAYIAQLAIHKQKFIRTHIQIGEHQSYEEFAKEVDKIKLFGQTTYTGKALRKVKYDFENSRYYNKADTKQVMILLTDGKSNDPNSVPQNAHMLRSMNVTTFAIGVGDVNRTELQLIASGTPNDETRVFTIQDYTGLDAIAKELETEIGTILEGGGQKNKSSYGMEFAELGLSTTYSKPTPLGLNLVYICWEILVVLCLIDVWSDEKLWMLSV